jgi:hypothetical protein
MNELAPFSLYRLNKQGEPEPESNLLEWANWFDSAKLKLAHASLDGIEVSTVFLGVNHGPGGSTPRLWETMITGTPIGRIIHRHSYARAEAETTHNWLVNLVATLRKKAE